MPPLSEERSRPAAVRLGDGRVLVAGGQRGRRLPRLGGPLRAVQQHVDPVAGDVAAGRFDLLGAALPGGGALIAGGFHESSWDATAFAYRPGASPRPAR